MRSIVLLILVVISSSAFSVEQVRTFLPASHKFYGGLGNDAWWSDSPGLCGVQLVSDCWGHHIGYVKESTPGANVICSTLLAAKAAKTEVDFVLDVSSSHQCEIIQVNYK
mgnify:CR=1 FL=1|jgi:hypothetical protein